MAPRSRASTAAGRRRATARAGERAVAHPRSKPAAKKPAAKKRAPAKSSRKPAKRAGSAPPKRRAPKRTAARAPRRAPQALARERDGFSWPQRLVLLLCAVAVLAAGYLFWLRDSSLVAVNDVEVAGVSTDREAIVTELTRVGEQMTTLHVDREAVEKAAAAFPTVQSVAIDPNFPHGLRIEVTERPPAVLVKAGGEAIPAAADGTLLTGVAAPDGLPVIDVSEPPGGKTLTGEAREQAVVAGAVPGELRPLIERVDSTDDHGVDVTLRGEIPVYFGDSANAAAKWAAAAAVMADPELDYARCVDVRIPARPSVCQDEPVTEPAPINPSA